MSVTTNMKGHELRCKVELKCTTENGDHHLYVDLPLSLPKGHTSEDAELEPIAARFLDAYQRSFPDLSFTSSEIVWR